MSLFEQRVTGGPAIEVKIGHDGVDAKLIKNLERAQSVSGRNDVPSVSIENPDERCAKLNVILDDEDGTPFVILPRFP